MNDSFYYYSFKAGHSGHHGGHGGKGKGKGKHSKHGKIGHLEQNLKHDKNYHEALAIGNEHNKQIQAKKRQRLSHLRNINNRGALDAKKARDVNADNANKNFAITSGYATAYNAMETVKDHAYIFTDVGIAGLALLIGQNIFKKKVIPDKLSTFAWAASLGSLAVGLLSSNMGSKAMAAGEEHQGRGNHNENHPGLPGLPGHPGHPGIPGHPGHHGHPGRIGHPGRHREGGGERRRGKFHPGHYLHGVWYPGYYEEIPIWEYPYPYGYPYPYPDIDPYLIEGYPLSYPYYYGGVYYDRFGHRFHHRGGDRDDHHDGRFHLMPGHHPDLGGFHPGGHVGGGDHDGGGFIPHPSGGDHGVHGGEGAGGGGGGFHPGGHGAGGGGAGGAGAGTDTAAGRLTHSGSGAHFARSYNTTQLYDKNDIMNLGPNSDVYGPKCPPGKPCLDLASNYARSYHSAIFPELGYQEDFNFKRQQPYIRQTKGTSLINPPDVILPMNIVTGTAIHGAANPIDDLNHVPAFVSDIY